MSTEETQESAPVHTVVMPPNLDAWVEAVDGPVVLVIQPSRSGIGGQSTLENQCYAHHARYFDSEAQAAEWYEANRKWLQSCIVARYPIVDGRSS